MLFCRHMLLICVILIYLNGSDTVDVTGFQIVKFRKHANINMSVVLRNIPRSSKLARLYFKKYKSTFPYKTVNVSGTEAVFENLMFPLNGYESGRIMQSTIILQNNTKYGDKEVMELELVEYLKEGDKREDNHACLKSCRIIIDYDETTSTSNNKKETPPSSSPIVDIYPNTSIIYKPNSKHNIACIGDKPRFNSIIRLYQIKNGKYDIRTNTNSNVLIAMLNLTERDNGTSLQCYIMWKHYIKHSKRIHLLLNVLDTNDGKSPQDEYNAVSIGPSQVTSTQAGIPDGKFVQDETNAVSVGPSQVALPNAESSWKIGLVTTIIIIIILLIIIITIVVRAQRSKSQEFLRSGRSSFSGNFRNLAKKYDTGLKTNDYTRGLPTTMELWRNNEYYANENPNFDSNYYSYPTIH